jgi:hypothetical protein
MCAIDALGIPYMLGGRGEIHAQEPNGPRVIRVTVDPEGAPAWTPAHAVAVAALGDGCCLAQAACPHINFFASPEAAASYLDAHTLQGTIRRMTVWFGLAVPSDQARLPARPGLVVPSRQGATRFYLPEARASGVATHPWARVRRRGSPGDECRWRPRRTEQANPPALPRHHHPLYRPSAPSATV